MGVEEREITGIDAVSAFRVHGVEHMPHNSSLLRSV